jgi:hypothetical protein
MKMTYDIFRRVPGLGLIWVEAVQDLEIARARIASLLQSDPGDYYVYDLRRAQVVFAVGASA